MTDFEDASAAGFQHVYPNASVAGCWFHYAQVIIKRTNKIGLKEAYGSDEDVQNVVQCLVTGESAAAAAGRTLRPYTIIRTDNEED